MYIMVAVGSFQVRITCGVEVTVCGTWENSRHTYIYSVVASSGNYMALPTNPFSFPGSCPLCTVTFLSISSTISCKLPHSISSLLLPPPFPSSLHPHLNTQSAFHAPHTVKLFNPLTTNALLDSLYTTPSCGTAIPLSVTFPTAPCTPSTVTFASGWVSSNVPLAKA